MVDKIRNNISDEYNKKFETIYMLHRRSMYTRAYRIVKNEYTAEDMVHLAFLRILEHLDKIDETNSNKTRAYLITIVEHLAIDYYRKMKHENYLSYDELNLYIYDYSYNPYNQSNYISDAIAKLPTKYSSVLNLKYKLGYNNAEIAKFLHTNETNVRKRLSRAKDKLSKILELNAYL